MLQTVMASRAEPSRVACGTKSKSWGESEYGDEMNGGGPDNAMTETGR